MDSQEHRCRQYAEENGLEVEQVFPDDGISGGLFDRPAMKSLIRFLDENWQENYVVIFDDLKRFARDVDVHRGLKRELKGRGVKLCCLNYTFDDSPEGEFVETVFAAQNELERKQNRRQVCQKMKARLERGYWCFQAPFGYEYMKTKEHGKLLIPNRDISEIISEGLVAFANDQLVSQLDLLEFFRQSKLGEKENNPRIDFNFVKRLLMQPLYAGRVEYRPWSIPQRQGMHAPIISVSVYEKIQDKLKRPLRMPRATDNIEFPLRRIITCAICGEPMTGSSCRGKNPNRYFPYYTCNNARCEAKPKNITSSLVETQYIELLESIKADTTVLDITNRIVNIVWERRVLGQVCCDKAVLRELTDIKKQISEYIELMPLTKSDAVRALYEAKIEELSNRTISLEKQLHHEIMPNIDEAMSLALKFIGTPASFWKRADLSRKGRLHNLIFVENPRYSRNMGFGTPKLTPPFHIKSYVGGQIYNLVDIDQKFWNTFIDTVIDWCPILKDIID